MFVEGHASSMAELLAEVRRIARVFQPDIRAPEELWFRGQGRQKWALLPALYRPKVAKYGYDEETLFERFKALSIPLVPQEPRTDWDWYFLAQHFGLPTRLLDWTENLLAAAYFALLEHTTGRDRPTLEALAQVAAAPPVFDKKAPTVLMLDAGTLNQYTFGPKYDCVLVPGSKLDNYLPGQLIPERERKDDRDNRWPIAILPGRASSRIVAQQGMFTLHGRETIPLEALDTSTTGNKAPALGRITLDRLAVPRLWRELELVGIHRLALFPDLDGVAHHVCWTQQNDPVVPERRRAMAAKKKSAPKKKGPRKTAKKK
jgi:hypothetical protein